MAWSIVLTSMAQTCTNQPRNERFKYDTLPHSTTTKLASNRRPRSSISNPEVGGSSPTHCQGRLELPGCVGAGFCPRADCLTPNIPLQSLAMVPQVVRSVPLRLHFLTLALAVVRLRAVTKLRWCPSGSERCFILIANQYRATQVPIRLRTTLHFDCEPISRPIVRAVA